MNFSNFAILPQNQRVFLAKKGEKSLPVFFSTKESARENKKHSPFGNERDEIALDARAPDLLPRVAFFARVELIADVFFRDNASQRTLERGVFPQFPRGEVRGKVRLEKYRAGEYHQSDFGEILFPVSSGEEIPRRQEGCCGKSQRGEEVERAGVPGLVGNADRLVEKFFVVSSVEFQIHVFFR